MSDLIIKVTPEEVKTKAAEIAKQEALMEDLMNDMQNKVNILEEYVKTSAGKSYLEQYVSVKGNVAKSLDAISQHVANLNEAADRYSALDNETKKIPNQLSTESIF